ncbi:OLC1v1005119C1 [Oldenlandia corymbosa var. corymbosa]|uniref:Thymidylate kinase n=1 Tax=Oldenlandia corymbosa var. corymbosa TaxID=529605 RepID=A0AAV1DDY0_OLDCO|nr:OLC1v1005119C1 [Oldenlandia corymbosa var. corymbosa]
MSSFSPFSFGILFSLRNIGRVTKYPWLNSPFELNFQSKHSFGGIGMGSPQHNDLKKDSRGALIVLEGLDRCGKTSQSARLLSSLEGLRYSVESWRFPDRTGVGLMISSYLSNQSQLDDHAIHLLFSANRWEKRSLMEAKLMSGTTLIVDRYSYSGVAFSSAKGLDFQWCKVKKKNEVGLLAPDLVFYLDISLEKAAERGGYGGERYEQLEFQKKVAESYKKLTDASWKEKVTYGSPSCFSEIPATVEEKEAAVMSVNEASLIEKIPKVGCWRLHYSNILTNHHPLQCSNLFAV